MPQLKNAKGRPFAWSHSRRKDFKNCPAQYAASHFYCTVPYYETPEAVWGNRVHKAAEMFLKGRPHPDTEALLPVEPACTKMIRSGCPIQPELQIAFDRNLKPVSWFAGSAWVRMQIDVVLEKTPTVCLLYDWKGLALDTDILTTQGWKTMDTLRVGDKVFSRSGKPCRVVAKSPVFNKPCYRVQFRDGASVVCDEDHLWLSSLAGTGLTKSQRGLIVRSTKDIFDVVKKGHNISIPLAAPLHIRSLDVYENGIHPYLLGAWLGDGSASKGEICKPNIKLFSYIGSLGYKVGPDISGKDRAETHTIYGLTPALSASGLLNNKHLPTRYLLSNYGDRVSLIRGLLDTDGYWNKVRSQATFTTTKVHIAYGVAELLSSVGQRPYIAKVRKNGFGREVTAYDINFTPLNLNPFLNHPSAILVDKYLSNKRDIRSTKRYISKIEKIESVPTQCISVDSEDNTYLCTKRHVVTHNTSKKIRHDEDQLRLNAAGLSLINPQYERFEGRYIWTAHDNKTTPIQPVTKEEVNRIWEEGMVDAFKMEEAWRLERFPATPGPLCPWCRVDNCKKRKGERRV